MLNRPAAVAGSALEPLRSPLFARLWAATLVSNFGTLIQSVGAAWLMTQLVRSSDMVAFVQAATALPVMLLSIPAGALADIADRRLVMLAALLLLALFGCLLTVFGFLHALTPWGLLLLTFLLGCASALYGPAWQASVGEQVPVRLLPAAVALNSLNFNVARTLGPAIGGMIVAGFGASGAFLVNVCSCIGLYCVLLCWKRPLLPMALPPESIGSAIATGLRYVRLSGRIRVVIERAALFGFGAGGVWATLPLIARDLLGGGPLVYGTLLGGFGAGAVVAALASTHLRRRYGHHRVATTATVAFASGALLAGSSHLLALTLGAVALCGGSWVLSFSTFNVVVQLSSPRWVVGRALAIYQTSAFGGAALGAAAFGIGTERYGLTASLSVSAAVLLVSAVLVGRYRVITVHGEDELGPLPVVAAGTPGRDVPQEAGPIVVTVEYRVLAENVEAFLRAAHELGRTRQRDGARRWSLMQDLDEPTRFVERYQALTWLDHLRQWQRATLADQSVRERVLALHDGPLPPQVRHLWAREPDSESLPTASHE